MSGFQDEPLAPGCYSELLFTPDENILFLDSDGSGFASSFSSSSSSATNVHHHVTSNNNTPRMLCFGDYVNNTTTTTKTGHGSGPNCTASALVVESTNRAKITAHVLPSSNRKRNGSGCDWKQDPGVTVNAAGAPVGSRKNTKKSKSDDPSTVTTGHAKGGKKEKLGERITALQQLVSPFGKTDTASVLHEAFGYIKFLQDQVQVLCSPYLQCPPSSSTGLHNSVNEENVDDEIRKTDLRSQGLCLVPMELTLHVADSNGADLWSSAAMLHHNTSN